MGCMIIFKPATQEKANPTNPNALTWIKAHHDSPHGRISVSWKKQSDGSLLYETVVPPNTTAELTLPQRSPWSGVNGGTIVLTLEPGSHRFEVK